MPINNIHIKKLNLINWILEKQDIRLVEKILEFKSSIPNIDVDWYEDLSDSQKKEIEKSIFSLDKEEYIDNNIVQEDIEEYIKNKTNNK